MKYTNTLEYTDAINQLIKRNSDIISLAKSENRELTDDESQEFDKNEEEVKELNDEKEELEKELDNPVEDDKEEKSNKNISIDNKMETKKFSLVEEIRNSIKTGESIKLDRSGIPYSVQSEGEDLVQVDVFNVLEPLRAKLALVQAGAHFIDGLHGDVQLPIMNAGNVFWAGENADASDGSGSFTSITLSPKRLTAYVEVSLQLLQQDTVGAEEAIRNDLIASIAQKIESTVLGDAAGTSTQPAGIFYGKTPVEIQSYNDLCNFEADLEEDNVYGNMHYILSPKAKAELKSMIRGTNNSGFVMEGNEVNGVPAVSTSNVEANMLAYGDFNALWIGSWSDIILDVVRDSSSLKKGCVTLVVNMYVDAALARPEAIAVGDTTPA